MSETNETSEALTQGSEKEEPAQVSPRRQSIQPVADGRVLYPWEIF